MAVSEKDRLREFIAFLKKHGVTVISLARGDRSYRFVIEGDYRKLPEYTKSKLRTFEEGGVFCAYVKIKQLAQAITAPPGMTGKWKTKLVKIDGKMVETKVAKVRIPGIAFNGQFTLENDGRCGVVDIDSKASDYAKRRRR